MYLFKYCFCFCFVFAPHNHYPSAYTFYVTHNTHTYKQFTASQKSEIKKGSLPSLFHKTEDFHNL